jgi:lysophospholipase L1-like esterase
VAVLRILAPSLSGSSWEGSGLVRIVACALAGAFVLALAGTARPAPGLPQRYYLALGDSLTYGIQPDKVDAGLLPRGFDTGFVDVFARRLRKLAPRLQVVNYGCPGESTVSFVAGGCPWLAGGRSLHAGFRGAQLDAALAFLRTHPNAVSPVTLNLGGNDAQAFSDACNGSFACARSRAPRALRQLASRLGSILHRLRLAAPRAEIIVVGLWNNDLSHPRESDPLYRTLDLTIGRVAATVGARFADPFPLFDLQENLARRRARICALTFTCSRGDGHPTDAGYRAIAAAVYAASGYRHN